MRLDHLLSRERIRREIGGFIPGRYTEQSVLGARRCANGEKPKKIRSIPVMHRSNDCQSSLACIVFRDRKRPDMYLENCTARWKTSCKKPVAKAERPEIAGMRQFCSWSQEKKRIKIEKSIFDNYSVVTIKLLRAQGGCHGTGRRRKTW